MNKIKLAYIISNINKSLAFEWIVEHLDKQKFDLYFLLLNPDNTELEDFLRENNVTFKRITYRGKKDILKAFFATYFWIVKNNIQIVHTHLFDANIVGLLAAKLAPVKKRIYTRHHSTLHHQYFPKAVKYDQFCNTLATHVVAISKVVQSVLVEKDKLPKYKSRLIYHGFDLAIFDDVSADRINQLRTKHNVTEGAYPIIGVIARQTEWKGIQYIIPAFKRLLETYPAAHLILANAHGDYKSEIDLLLSGIPKTSYTEIQFEADLPALYQIFDVYVHTPINDHSEAFGQTYVEALAAGVPCIFTKSGIANEFIAHDENALIVSYENSDDIYHSILRLLSDKNLQQTLVENGKTSLSLFTIDRYINKLEDLYTS